MPLKCLIKCILSQRFYKKKILIGFLKSQENIIVSIMCYGHPSLIDRSWNIRWTGFWIKLIFSFSSMLSTKLHDVEDTATNMGHQYFIRPSIANVWDCGAAVGKNQFPHKNMHHQFILNVELFGSSNCVKNHFLSAKCIKNNKITFDSKTSFMGFFHHNFNYTPKFKNSCF